MNQIVALQILFGSLVIGILMFLIILIGYPTYWLIRRIRMQKRFVGSQEWLEGPSKDTTYEELTSKQISIVTSLKSASRRRKFSAVAIIFMLFFMSIWLSWELSRNGHVDSNVYNNDTRVFSEAYVEDNASCLFVLGSHDLTLDTRWCILESYSIPFSPQTNCYPNITARWNLTCKLSTGIFGYASVEVSYLLRDINKNRLWDILVYNLTTSEHNLEFNKIQEKSGISEYRCHDDNTYLVSVVLRITLSGVSSVEGLEPGTPLSLIIENITSSDSS